MLARKKCLDDIRLHKVCTKKLRKLISITTYNAEVKKQLTKGLIWHIRQKRELRQMLIDDLEAFINED